jgi:hypothetical protein
LYLVIETQGKEKPLSDIILRILLHKFSALDRPSKAGA